MNKIYALGNNIITTRQLEPSAWCSGFLSRSYCKQTWWLVLYGTDRYDSGVKLSARKQISIFLKLSHYFFDQEFAGKSDQFAWSRNLNAVYQYRWKVQSSESSWSESPEASWLHFHKVSFQSAVKQGEQNGRFFVFSSHSCPYRAKMSAIWDTTFICWSTKGHLQFPNVFTAATPVQQQHLSNSIKVRFLWFERTARQKGWFNINSKTDCGRVFFFFFFLHDSCIELKDLQFWKFERHWQ